MLLGRFLEEQLDVPAAGQAHLEGEVVGHAEIDQASLTVLQRLL